MKTVLMVTPYFPPNGGGLENYAIEIAKHLAKTGKWRVIFLTSGKTDNVYNYQGITIYSLSYRLKISNTPISFRWFTKVRRVLSVVKPDIINVHLPVPGLADIVGLLSGKTPLIVTYHAGSMAKNKLLTDVPIWLYEHLFLNLLLQKAQRIVCGSDFIRFNLLKRYMDKSQTITPGVDTKIFKPGNVISPYPNILFVAGLGRAEQHKGLATLLKAARILSKAKLSFRLTIVGKGDMSRFYRKIVKRYGLANIATFTGRLTGSALVKVYQNASLFVLPTENDSLPTVVIEAMACGLPVITTDVGSTSTLVKNGQNGFLIQPKNSTILANKIKYLLSHQDLATKMLQTGRKIIVSNYDWTSRAVEYAHLYQLTLKNSPTIVHVSAYYPPHLGGMEKVAEKAVELTIKSGLNVQVLTSSNLPSFEVAHTPITPTLPWHLFSIPKHSLIHLHLSQAYYPELVLIISQLRRIPFLVHFHLDVDKSGPLGNLFLLYKKIIWPIVLRRASRVVVCSEGQRDLVVKKYNVNFAKVSVIPNGVGQEFFIKNRHAISRHYLKLLYVGRLTVQKRVDRLIQTMALLPKETELTVIGDGEDRQKLEDLATSLHLTNIKFVGVKNAQEIHHFHQTHDALLISSDREGGTPLVALEAMAAGLPVIGTNTTGIRDLLNGIGIVVDEPYPQNFAVTIKKLMHNHIDLDRLSQLSYKTALKYTWSNFNRQLQTIYANY
jgi:glycosyltransferase involved in cell wall biosynthesis